MTASIKGVRVFVTGASGFIGSHLCRRLLREGARVFAFLRRDSDMWRVRDIARDFVQVMGDLRDADGMRRALREIRPEIIFHLAALVDVSRSLDLLDEMMDINVRGTMALIKGLKNVEYRCFVNTGASEEYGLGPSPFREDQTPAPVSPYSASKSCSTMVCGMLHRGLGLPMVTLRPFLTYGPFQTGDMLVPSTVRKAISGDTIKTTRGEQTRDLVFVSDIVEGYLLAAQRPEALGEVINLGTGREHRVRDVVELIVRMSRSKSRVDIGALPYRPGEARRFVADGSKAARLLGWTPKVDLEDGLRETISWYRDRLKHEAAGAPGKRGS